MTIDKNNWFIREDSLTEEQYIDVCKYLVENYEVGTYPDKVQELIVGDSELSGTYDWDFLGVMDGEYTTYDQHDLDILNISVPVITYQQFLENIKGVVSTANSTADTSSENPWIDWKGGECPVGPNSIVEVLLGNGHTLKGLARDYGWKHNGYPSFNIIKYRVIPDTNSTSNTESDTNLPVLCENPSQSLTDTLEWMFELGVERVEADSERITITHKHIGKIVMDVKVDFKDIKSMLEGLKGN